MIEVQTPLGLARVCESLADLPEPRPCERLYADCETNSFDDRVPGFEAYSGHRACGWAITWDDEPGAWYVPVRHQDKKWNLPLLPVLEWLERWLRCSKQWVNHNVKFDAHFQYVDTGYDLSGVELVDTVLPCKMLDSDRMSYDLKVLLRQVLGVKTEEQDRVKAYLKGVRSKNYARVPADILGQYACADVIGDRALHKYCLREMPAEMFDLWETEKKLTLVLFDMERDGLRVDRQRCMIEKRKSLIALISAAQEILDLTGVEYVDSNACAHEIISTQLGLPVVKWNTDDFDNRTSPCYDKHALEEYMGMGLVATDPKAKRVLELLHTYRQEEQFKSLFADSFLEKMTEQGRIHSTYNQLIRTARMSCSHPNTQQFSPRAGDLIIPDDDEAFLCYDASQMEFRIIVHIIKDFAAIEEYATNPKTDFHQWVADLCGIKRKPAKVVNFAIAYGAGRRNVTGQLMRNEDIAREIEAKVATLSAEREVDRAALHEELCRQRADEVWSTYHNRLPGIRATSQQAQELCKLRGWVRNPYGRRRHLPPKASHKAFNSYVQGTAGDVAKDRMVAIAPRFCARSRELGVKLAANKHDELLLSGPREVMFDARIQAEYGGVLQDTKVHFRVPIVWDYKASDKSWRDAKP